LAAGNIAEKRPLRLFFKSGAEGQGQGVPCGLMKKENRARRLSKVFDKTLNDFNDRDIFRPKALV
jgi:hypothetical protein